MDQPMTNYSSRPEGQRLPFIPPLEPGTTGEEHPIELKVIDRNTKEAQRLYNFFLSAMKIHTKNCEKNCVQPPIRNARSETLVTELHNTESRMDILRADMNRFKKKIMRNLIAITRGIQEMEELKKKKQKIKSMIGQVEKDEVTIQELAKNAKEARENAKKARLELERYIFDNKH